jgi:putative transposase
MKFEPFPQAQRLVPHVLAVRGTDGASMRYLRLTHRFDGFCFGVWVSTAAEARNASRPQRFSWEDIIQMEQDGGVWGRMSLPFELARPLEHGTPDPADASWRIIEPLVDLFSRESNLARDRFSHLATQRSLEIGVDIKTVKRLLARYYYFGQDHAGLRSLIPGRRPNELELRRATSGDADIGDVPHDNSDESIPSAARERPGRRASVESTFGKNTFIVSPEDIEDMVARLSKMAKDGRTYVKEAYVQYLKIDFPRRHPELFEEVKAGRHPAPVSIWQFRRYINEHLSLTKDIAKNLRTRSAKAPGKGSLDSAGPGDIYEIDATGGRIVLVTSGPARRLIAQPTIYVIIDRWSRFIVSIYVSLKPPSWDEARYATLIAFTSREKRFSALGVDITDKRWPIGRVCSVLRRDRGSELTSESMDKVISGDMRIDPSTLPSVTPNGKAIIERFMRTLKGWMARNVKGSYAERPMDLHAKRAAKRAKQITVHSLAELYRALIVFVEKYNNTPHSHLKKLGALKQAGIPPTPQAAYLWGCEHMTGARVTSYSDSDMQRLMLGVDQASTGGGELRYKTRRYVAANAAARAFLAARPAARKALQVRVDKTFPYELFVESRTDWPRFTMVPADKRALGYLTLDEYDALTPAANAATRDLEHELLVAEVTADPAPRRQTVDIDRATPTQRQLADDRHDETTALKATLTGKQAPQARAEAAKEELAREPQSEGPEWKRRADEKRAIALAKLHESRGN